MIEPNHLRIMQYTLAGVSFLKTKNYDVYDVCRLMTFVVFDVCRFQWLGLTKNLIFKNP